MVDFLDACSIQYGLESAPQGYRMDTEYGHVAGGEEPNALLENPVLREPAIRTTVQLVVGERCARAAASGLIDAAPDEPSKRFLATQTLDEPRHTEVFAQRLYDLGVKKAQLEHTLAQPVNPDLAKFAEVLLEKVDAVDFVAGVAGQNVILEAMAFSVFEMMHAANTNLNPKFANTRSGVIADEERARARAASPGSGPAPGKWQGVDLTTADPEALEAALADTTSKEFEVRLERIGIEYQTPVRP
ncbi:MAG: ferritin-like domain-containing protein [Deltaproteobacteria bacterium]|nr:MAG: ferritin-like domain-containing protein [Deltaproteobacteria bacterium]